MAQGRAAVLQDPLQGGIGWATSLALAGKGGLVAINYSRSRQEAEETVQLIQSLGGHSMAIRADVSKDQEVRGTVENIVQRFGTLDLLVNNASVTRHIPLSDLDAATGLGSSLPYAVSKAAGREEQMQQLAPNLLLQQISTPEDIAQLICASLEQEAMTGQIITVDSSQTM